ncbi:MAG: alpha/beta hydrolase [Chloroflexi bacterium]|nr:alpha/beta hydrolase [Chloroflexota bacterium]
MSFAVLDGVRIYYEVAGGGHPVIFLHGQGVDHREWQFQVEAISKTYTVVTYDHRGHGKSAAPETGYTTQHYSKDLYGLIRHLGMTKPSIVGHSMGGNVAMDYALTHPEAITTLTLVDSGLDGFERDEAFIAKAKRRRKIAQREGLGEKFVRASLRSDAFAGLRDKPELMELSRQMLSGWSGASWKDKVVYPHPEKWAKDRLEDLKVPTLVMVGERDGGRFHRVASLMGSKIRVVRTVTLANVGHMPQMEDPEAFNDTLVDFLGGAIGKALI